MASVRTAATGANRLAASPAQPRIWPLFFLFLAVIAVLRIPTFSNRVFNSDEAYLATQAQVLVDGGRLYVDTVDRKPPVVPYLYAATFAVTGSDDLGPVRVLAVLAHALTALLLAAEARRRFTWRGAALTAGLLYLFAATAFFPGDAQAANFEVFMLPVMTGAVLLGVHNRIAASGFALGFATLTKQTAAAALLALAWLAWRWRRWQGLLTIGAAFAAPIALAAAVFGPHDFMSWVFTSNGGYLDARGLLGYVLALGARQTGWFLFGSTALVILLPWAWAHRREDADLWLWLLSGMVAVGAGLRFFPHYYLQLLPPLTLLAVRGLVSRPLNARPLILVAVAVLSIGTSLYFLEPAFAHGNSNDTRIALDVARYVRAHTKPSDRIMVWGQAPEVYWGSDRRPAIRFAATGFVTGTSGGRPLDHVGEQYAVPGAWDKVLSDLHRHPPVLVVDMSTADQRHASHYPPAHFPQFARFLDQGGWHQVALVDGAQILRPRS